MKKKTGISKLLDVSDDLAKIIGTKKGQRVTRQQVSKKLYAYINSNNLKDPENKAYFTPDKVMQPIFGSSKQRHFGAMMKHCKGHLTDPKKKL